MAQTASELAGILDAAARGRFPSPDGSVTIVPQPSHREAGVLAFTAHSVVFADEDPGWIRSTLDGIRCDPLAATMNPHFLAALMDRTGRRTDTIDLLTVATPLPGEPPLPLREIAGRHHPRARSAAERRDDVRVWAAEGGIVTLGRGLANRWEVSIEVDDEARDKHLGRTLAIAARHLVPGGSPIWSQQAAGNARSVRAFQAAGYRPVAAEALLY